ncbi:MAG: cell division protein FtsH [Anaerolineales bacterium]|nr:MAG: cell division protein FtsH [Anaerolineales bacterium]
MGVEEDSMESEKQPKRSNLNPIWWVIMVGLLAWNLYAFWPRSQPQITLPYSSFIAQVKDDHVKTVQISGSSIKGEFTQPMPGSDLILPTAPVPGTTVGSTTPVTYTTFTTTYPEVVGDTTLLPLLTAHNVEVSVTPSSSPLLALVLTYGLPILLMVGFLVLLGRQASRGQETIFSFGRSKARRFVEDNNKVTFKDVAGADEAKRELKEVVDFLRSPQKYHKLGARIPRGVLLVGPPGTGKTLLGRAVAGEANVPFYNISASEFVEMFVGVGASRVRTLFEQAKTTAPAIVFIDELDAVGRRRGAGIGTVNDEREQTLNQLLVEMDGFDANHEIIILAATNRPDVLDPALLRPGRFDRQVNVALPDRKGREGILQIHTRQINLASDIDLNTLARSTTGLSGADLANLCNEAALVAASKNHDSVDMQDFEEAIDRIILGEVRPLILEEEDRRIVAYHESGHALVAWLTPNTDPVHKVTIIPHGRALGVTEQMPEEDRYNYTKDELLARIRVMLGGRSAEEIACDDITTGAENDLVEATRLARRMITRWGMGSIGLQTIDTDETQPFLGYELTQGRDYSEQTAALIDRNIQAILDQCHNEVKSMLEREHAKLDALVDTLLKDETIDQDDLERILGPRVGAAMLAVDSKA